MSSDNEPQLAAPGAGLPALELFIARRLFALKRRAGNREAFNSKFQQERQTIRALVDSCEASLRAKRVLIPRLRGLEDSSRNWSVWMTLDHLRITNMAFAHVITTLTQGRVPEGRASTVAVKPDAGVTSEIESAYERSCDGVLEAAAGAADLKTSQCYAHPWFGPLDAAGWHALAATHMGIHRAQIARIIAGQS